MDPATDTSGQSRPASTEKVSGPPLDRATQLAEQRTDLAKERSFLAAERTLMAWVRTSLSMISFGFTLVKFFEYLATSRGPLTGMFGRQWSTMTVGLAMITIGTLALIAAVFQHRQLLQQLERIEGLTPRWSLALTVAICVAVLGVYAFASLVIR